MALLILHYKYIDYGIYALLVIMSFAVFLLLIGMGMVSSYVLFKYYINSILIQILMILLVCGLYKYVY